MSKYDEWLAEARSAPGQKPAKPAAPPKKAESKKEKWMTIVAAIALVAIALGVILAIVNDGNDDTASVQSSPSAAPSTSIQASPSDCPDGTQPLNYVPRDKGVGDVVQRPGDEDKQYKFEDKEGLLKAAAEDPVALATYLHEFLPVDYPNGQDYKSLIDESGKCLNAKGMEGLNKLKLFVTNLPMQIGEASETAVNTGSNSDGVVSNSAAGISGDRKAMVFDIPNSGGKQVTIMLRCGNPTHEAAAYPQVSAPQYFQPIGGGDVPPPYQPPPDTGCVDCGTTPPPPPPPVEECPPGATLPYPECFPPVVECPPGTIGTPPVCKDLPTNDPAPRGNAPQGGGHNDTDGPGEYIPPQQMDPPPATSRVNPPPPPPVVVAPESGGPTPEPTTAAPPPPAPGVNGTPGGTGTVTEPDTGDVVVDGTTDGF